MKKIIDQIRKIIIEDDGYLLKNRKKDKNFPTKGYCYVASEALYHLVTGGKSFCLKVNNDTHWFLMYDNKIVDITYDQFQYKISYNLSIGKGFLTKLPSKRAKYIIETIERNY